MRYLRLLLIVALLGVITTKPSSAASATDSFRPMLGTLIQITRGADGAIWCTYQFKPNDTILRIAPDGQITGFEVPTPISGLASITAGPDGNLWFTEVTGNKIGRLAPDGTIQEFALPHPSSFPDYIVAGPDGNLWFTEGQRGAVGRITPSGNITEFPIPGNQSLAIAMGPDNNLWFVEGIFGPNTGRFPTITYQLARMTISGLVTEFALPQPYTLINSMVAGPDGNLWFVAGADSLGRLHMDGTFTEFKLPPLDPDDTYHQHRVPANITVGPDGALWFSEGGADRIGRMTTNGQYSEFPLPHYESHPTAITTGPDGNLWFIESSVDQPRIGRLTPTGTVTEFQPPVPHNAQYFAATGYFIGDPASWDYFQSRGGTETFGYPVSRRFSLRGFDVQIFQRHVLQAWPGPDRSIHPLNLLDPDWLPITTLNYSTFPAHDPAVAMAAPQPNTPNYGQAVAAYLQASVPDTWDGKPVHFLQTYLAAAPANTGGARPLYALEVWGFPTSTPAPDPHNPNFIYQRFQRGILQYDATTGTTHGILLADALKDVLLGQGPADLQQQLHGSPFFRQYCPNHPGWICRPDDLPKTNLSFAFEQQ